MSEENIKLPDFVLAELYKDCLVELENPQEEKQSQPAKNVEKAEVVIPATVHGSINYLGENKKHVTVILDEANALNIKENELDFLTKILTACNLNLADIAILNINKQTVTFAEVQEQLKPKQVLLLGTEPTAIKLPFTIPHFQVQPYAGCTFVYTPALSHLIPNTPESKLLKSKLWLSLKSAFNL